MFIILLGLNHKTAPVEIREKLAMSKAQIKAKASHLQSLNGVHGVVVLSTCNRTEFYIATKDLELGKRSLFDFVADYGCCTVKTLEQYIYLKECREAVHHLFRVSAGLDSMILGETQILGQVQDAYEYALEFKISNNVLNTLFQKAISVGKRVRTETFIDRQAVSVSSAAVELAKQIFGDLAGRSVLILGAGETSELTARHLVANGVSTVIVANRTFERANQLAREFGGKAIRLDDFYNYLDKADIVISCTAAPKYIVEAKNLEPFIKERQNRPILFIDIAVPRDINPDVLTLENVSLYDVDDLQNVVEQNLTERKKEAEKAEVIIKDELEKFFQWLDSLFVIPTVIALKDHFELVKTKELERALRKLDHLSEKDKRVVCTLANSIVNQLLHNPMTNLKEHAHGDNGALYAEAIQTLFDLSYKNTPLKKEGML
ncbi:MAG: glutamyl-tRNA reductase [Clostridia bacterium]|nr:glutamyl-tRNA reductase [Clostridia bacterium]